MVKKVLSIAAAAAITVTGVSAFDIFDDGIGQAGLPYTFNNGAPVSPTGIQPNLTATTSIRLASLKQQGDALIFPAFFAGNGWETNLRVVNTSKTNAVVAKVVLYAFDDSRELRDFNIYLSAGDVWTGTVKVDADGTVRLVSTDDSSPLENGNMASEANPMVTKQINAPAGYIAVIGAAMTVDPTHDFVGAAGKVGAPYNGLDFKNASAHNDHANLRRAYLQVAAEARNRATPVVFNNGVITSGIEDPNINASIALTPRSNVGGDNRADYFFTGVANVLTGDVRITDTVNGKDMVMPAIKLQNVTEEQLGGAGQVQALLYVEGEKAHIADRTLTGVNGAVGSTPNNPHATHSEYHYAQLANDAAAFNTNEVWVTYGDSTSLADNQLVLTSPYKRVLVNADVSNMGTTPRSLGNIGGAAGTPIIAGIYRGVQGNGSTITNYGYFSGLALIYNEKEQQAQASQFSPARTPTLNFYTELALSEGNTNETDNLSYYLTQAQQSGDFARGYTDLQFIVNGRQTSIPVIATQMLATEVNGKIITNWITPEQR